MALTTETCGRGGLRLEFYLRQCRGEEEGTEIGTGKETVPTREIGSVLPAIVRLRGGTGGSLNLVTIGMEGAGRQIGIGTETATGTGGEIATGARIGIGIGRETAIEIPVGTGEIETEIEKETGGEAGIGAEIGAGTEAMNATKLRPFSQMRSSRQTPLHRRHPSRPRLRTPS